MNRGPDHTDAIARDTMMPVPSELSAWRRETRARLLRERMALDAATHQERSEAILRRIAQSLSALGLREGGFASNDVLGAYCAFRGEVDVTSMLVRHVSAGGSVALPAVVAKGAALVFRAWSPGDALATDSFGLLCPGAGPAVLPAALLVPLVGFDRSGYRLGYGGGFYDRTLSQWTHAPLTIGIGFASAELATIYPQAHDVPLDLIVTDEEIIACHDRRP